MTNAGSMGGLDMSPITPFDDQAQSFCIAQKPRTEPFFPATGRLFIGNLVSARAQRKVSFIIDEVGGQSKALLSKIGDIFLFPHATREDHIIHYPSNYFDLLEIPKEVCDQYQHGRAPHEVLRQGFTEQILMWHPDKQRGLTLLCDIFERGKQQGKFAEHRNTPMEEVLKIFATYCRERTGLIHAA